MVPMMGVFNNLVIYKQDEPKNSLQSIMPDLATRWWWSEDGSHLTSATVSNGAKWDSRNSPPARQLKREQPGGPQMFDRTSCADDDGEISQDGDGWGYASRATPPRP
jgi:hypothetical protein